MLQSKAVLVLIFRRGNSSGDGQKGACEELAQMNDTDSEEWVDVMIEICRCAFRMLQFLLK